MTISRFFFSCAVIGAVCGLVGGLMDSAAERQGKREQDDCPTDQ